MTRNFPLKRDSDFGSKAISSLLLITYGFSHTVLKAGWSVVALKVLG
jgi:hypothetical protein